MDVNLIKHKIKNILIFIRLYKEKDKFFTKDFFKSQNFEIGEYTYGKPHVSFSDEANLTIGKFCSIAPGVVIFLGGNHRVDWITTYPFNKINDFFPSAKSILGHPETKGNVSIGNDVWIGYDVLIMSGVTIGNGSVIGAKSVLTKNIGAYEIWAGNPAKFVKKRFDDDTIEFLEKTEWWNWDIEDIVNNIEVLCSTNVDLLKKK